MQQNQKGSAATVAIIVLLALSLVAVSIFALSSWQARQDATNRLDQIVSQAVEDAKTEQQKQLQAKFDEDYKKPHQTYRGPQTYGAVTFDYPKTWSAYVEEGSSQLIDGYFHPVVVPGTQSETAFALRLELLNDSYSQVVEGYESDITSGKLTARAYIPKKLEGAASVQPGLRLDGDVGSGNSPKQGAIVVMQVRDKTLKVYTESASFIGDFNNIVLPSLSFSP